jgi:thiamine biosynthesis lipoprotein
MPARIAFRALGTLAAVAVTRPEALPAALAVVAAEISACDRACSRFRPDSDISRFNAAAGRLVEISPRLYEELAAARRAARVTDGFFDPTVGRALMSIGYDRDFSLVAADRRAAPVTFTPVPGWQGLHLDPNRCRAQVPAGVMVDLGATAKARCADLAAGAAAAAAACGVLVSLGGDVSVAGPPPAGGWIIAVTDDSTREADGAGQKVQIRTGGLATSGVTVRAWRRGSIDLHHLIDPRTGGPAEVVWRTVSVAAASCLDANIASTAAVVVGHRAPDWLEERELPARLVAPDGTVTVVAGWPADPPASDELASDELASDELASDELASDELASDGPGLRAMRTVTSS